MSRQNGHRGQSTGSIKSTRSTCPEIAANPALVLIGVTCSLLDLQLAAQAEAFEKEAGLLSYSTSGAFRYGGSDVQSD